MHIFAAKIISISMKKYVLVCLLFSCLGFSQNSEKKVWNLLLSNNRTEARKLFDKDLKSLQDKNIDLLLLDAYIMIESGKISFDKQFASQFARFPESRFYLTALLKKSLLLNDINEIGFDDDTYSKIDLMANEKTLLDHPDVIYYKAIADRNRKRFAAYSSKLKELGAITKWQFCGVFENLNDSGLEIEYEPETHPQNDKHFDAKSNGIVGWYNPVVRSDEGYQIFQNESEYGKGIEYSQTFMDNPQQREVLFNFGTSSSIKIFLNDIEIYANNQVSNTDMEAFSLKVNLPQGMNRLLVKSALGDGSDYFILTVKDLDGHPLTDITYSDSFKQYQKSSQEQLNPIERPNFSEDFIMAKIKQDPDNALYKILLLDAYLYNKKLDLAYTVLENLDRQYPNSSLIKIKFSQYYVFKNEGFKSQEIVKNIEIKDPEYYNNILNKIQDTDWLKTANITELEALHDKLSQYPESYLKTLMEFVIAGRNTNIKLMTDKLDEILEESHNSEFYITSFAQFYDTLEKNKSKTIGLLEKLNSEKENNIAFNQLIKYYNEADKKDVVKQMYLERWQNHAYMNIFGKDYIDILINEKNYSQALVEIDKCLAQFPYSFSLMSKKGMVYNYLHNLKEAEKYFRQSLVYNSENSSLRKLLYDITKVPDEIEVVKVPDIYKYIAAKRNCKLPNDYGVTMLLDEYIVNIFPEGGRKSKVVMLYEITAANGIKEMKEYDLDTSGINLLKSEIVRSDGTVTPAEQGSDKLVFTDLRVGDVIHIDYEAFDNVSGRFYKDFNISYNFNGSYPCVQNIFGVICPQDMTFKEAISNDGIPSASKKINNKIYKSWIKLNTPAMPLFDDYAPNYNDVKTEVTISSILSWKEIANWYADMVQKTLKSDKVTLSAFNSIFPNGISGLSDWQKASNIYHFIEDNINYSSLDFRQSGYVPQKPSRTILTKLGDCKDVSTLFVALAELAGLKSNLVLVRTSDKGHSVKLPGIIFNHCIVRVALDNQEHFIELTNKYMPFNVMPMSLYNANALVISFDKSVNENVKLINLTDENSIRSTISYRTEVTVGDTMKQYKITTKVKGFNKSYYNELFSGSTTEDIRRKELEDDYNSRLATNIQYNQAKVIENDNNKEDMTFEITFSVAEKLQSVGNLKIMGLPLVDKVYTRNIIEGETRNYDIEYAKYENKREYDDEIIVNLSDGRKFSEIPDNKVLSYKNHHYTLSYELLNPSSLRIGRKVAVDWEDIPKAAYPNFKKYVEDVLEAEKQIIGFK